MTDLHPVTFCGQKKRDGSGTTCRRPAGWGTTHVGFGSCKLHGGAAPGPTKHAEKQRAAWEQTLIDEMDPSLKVIRQLRDGEDVPARDRIKAASWLVEQARSLMEGAGGELVLRIRWPD
jgi:hypothetical protein